VNKRPSPGWRQFLIVLTAVFAFFAGVLLAQGKGDLFATMLVVLFLIWLVVLVSLHGGNPRTE
jgi:hypothetical protein